MLQTIEKNPKFALTKGRIQPFHSLTLVNDSNIYPFLLTWLADKFYVVARLTAGNINVHVGEGRNPSYWRIDKQTLKLPIQGNVITVETVSASGYYDIYALKDFPDFDIES